MSSASRRANRANARLSTGPRTDIGKSVSSQNATRHGLCGKQIVIPGENPAEYDDLRTKLYTSYAPADEAENLLVNLIATSAWKLQRAQKIEAAAYAKITENEKDPITALANLLTENSAAVARIQRYVTQFERSYYRAIKELKLLKDARQAQAEAADTEAQPEVGFVPFRTASVSEPEPEVPASQPLQAIVPVSDCAVSA